MSEQFQAVPPPTPAMVPAPAGDKKGLAIASLVLGILSFCGSLFWYCGAPLAIVGLILGILSLKSSGRGMAIAGIVLAGIGILLAIVFAIIGVFSGPILQQIQSQLAPYGY